MWKRGEREYKATHLSNEIYEFYKDRCCNKGIVPVKYRKFFNIWDKFIDIRFQLVIFENLEFYMPSRIGSIRVEHIGEVFRINKNGDLVVRKDYGATNKMWREMYPDKTPEEIRDIKDKPYVYYTNDKTDGKLFKINWDKTSCVFKNHNNYSFRPVRKWNRMLKQHIANAKSIDYLKKVRYV